MTRKKKLKLCFLAIRFRKREFMEEYPPMVRSEGRILTVLQAVPSPRSSPATVEGRMISQATRQP